MKLLAIGRIGAPFGVDGWVKVSSYSGETDHFLDLTEVEARSGTSTKKLRIEDAEARGSGLVVKFAGYDSPETARAIVGFELWVPREQAAPRAEDEFYIADLVGCALYSAGKQVAVVEGVCDNGAGSLLEVNTGSGPAVLIPFKEQFIGAVDTETRRIELLAPWILE